MIQTFPETFMKEPVRTSSNIAANVALAKGLAKLEPVTIKGKGFEINTIAGNIKKLSSADQAALIKSGAYTRSEVSQLFGKEGLSTYDKALAEFNTKLASQEKTSGVPYIKPATLSQYEKRIYPEARSGIATQDVFGLTNPYGFKPEVQTQIIPKKFISTEPYAETPKVGTIKEYEQWKSVAYGEPSQKVVDVKIFEEGKQIKPNVKAGLQRGVTEYTDPLPPVNNLGRTSAESMTPSDQAFAFKTTKKGDTYTLSMRGRVVAMEAEGESALDIFGNQYLYRNKKDPFAAVSKALEKPKKPEVYAEYYDTVQLSPRAKSYIEGRSYAPVGTVFVLVDRPAQKVTPQLAQPKVIYEPPVVKVSPVVVTVPKVTVKTRQGQGQLPIQGQLPGQGQVPVQETTPIQGQLPGQGQVPVQEQIQGQGLRTTPTTTTKYKSTFEPTRPYEEPDIFKPKKKMLFYDEGKPKRYLAKVRRQGKFMTVGESGSLLGAVSIGERVTSTSLAASFKVESGGGETISLPILSGRFAPSKKDQSIAVQQRKFRLSSFMETSEIQKAKKARGIFR